MKKHLKTITLVIFCGLVLAGCSHLSKSAGPISNPLVNKSQDAGSFNQNEPEGKMVAGYKGKVIAGEASPLLEFNQEDYDKAVSSGKLVVVYFYANWCPICRQETANSLYPFFNELKRDNVIGFRVNFKDSDTDKDEQQLARDLNAPYQHFKVLIRNGKTLISSPEEWNKTRYQTEINNQL